MSKQKLELTWIGRERLPKLEPRILLEAPEKSYHASRLSDLARSAATSGKMAHFFPDFGANRTTIRWKVRQKLSSSLSCFASTHQVRQAARHRVSENDIFDNRLIFGDNLLAPTKIPKRVFSLCEWGRDDYGLNVANLPMAQMETLEAVTTSSTKTSKNKKVTTAAIGQGGLFEENVQ
jgi:hypothetical protein